MVTASIIKTKLVSISSRREDKLLVPDVQQPNKITWKFNFYLLNYNIYDS